MAVRLATPQHHPQLTQQTTPRGMLARAREFLVAGDMVMNRTSSKAFLPTYFLLGHSVELSLKAFLLHRGVAMETLKSRDLGHSLSTLLDEARRYQLSDCIRLTNDDEGVIKLLSYDYMTKRYEYDDSETFFMPLIGTASTVARRLAFGLQPVCCVGDKVRDPVDVH